MAWETHKPRNRKGSKRQNTLRHNPPPPSHPWHPTVLGPSLTDASKQGKGLPGSRLCIRASDPLRMESEDMTRNPAIVMLLSSTKVLPVVGPTHHPNPFPQRLCRVRWEYRFYT